MEVKNLYSSSSPTLYCRLFLLCLGKTQAIARMSRKLKPLPEYQENSSHLLMQRKPKDLSNEYSCHTQGKLKPLLRCGENKALARTQGKQNALSNDTTWQCVRSTVAKMENISCC